MEWNNYGKLVVGKREVEIKTLKLKDESGKVRRFRVCTIWNPFLDFTGVSATGRLYKDEKTGYIGVLITGKNMGYIKVGKSFLVQSSIIVSFECISKIALRKLLKDTHIETVEIDEQIVGVER